MERMSFSGEGYFNLEHIPATEEQVRAATGGQHRIDLIVLDNAIDLLLRLSYFNAEQVDVDSEDGWFHMFARNTYLRAPYTFKAIRDLVMIG